MPHSLYPCLISKGICLIGLASFLAICAGCGGDSGGGSGATAVQSAIEVRHPRTELVSGDPLEDHSGDSDSYVLAISGNGRYVGFVSSASNLLGEVNIASLQDPRLFLRDMDLGLTSIIDVGPGGKHGSGISISEDGRYVAFSSISPNLVEGASDRHFDIFVRDMKEGVTSLISKQLGNHNTEPSISADGRYVAFVYASRSIFVHDRKENRTVLASVEINGRWADGYRYGGECSSPSLSEDGRKVAFLWESVKLVPGGWHRRIQDAFVRDLEKGTTTLISVNSRGEPSNSWTYRVGLSEDGRYAAFASMGSNLVDGDTNGFLDVFVRDIEEGITMCVSVGPGGRPANAGSNLGSISRDGRFVTFNSNARNLVEGDQNCKTDVFVHDRVLHETRVISVSSSGGMACNISGFSKITADARFLAFNSQSCDLGGPKDFKIDDAGYVLAFNDVYRRGPLLSKDGVLDLSAAPLSLSGGMRSCTCGTLDRILGTR